MRSAVDPSSGFWRSLALYHFAVFASLSFRNLLILSPAAGYIVSFVQYLAIMEYS